MRLFATLLVLLFTGMASASDPLYRRVAYTATEYRYYCGRYYPYEVERYRYEVYYPPEPAKVVIPYAPGWKEAAIKARAEQLDYESYENTLRILGLTVPGKSYTQASTYGLQGDTRYGLTVSQVTDLYNRDGFDTNVQTMALLLQGMNATQDKGFNRLLEAVEKDGGNKARFLEMLIQGVNVERAFLASRGASQSRTETKVERTVTTPNQPQLVPEPVPASKPANRAFAKCLSCHAGDKAKGDPAVDLTRYDTFTPDQKRRVWNSVLSSDPDQRMPRGENGGEGDRLTAEEIRAILTR